MKYLNAERAGGDDHLSSSAPDSTNLDYHKILEPAKKRRTTPPSWGSVGSHRCVGKIIVNSEEIHAECD